MKKLKPSGSGAKISSRSATTSIRRAHFNVKPIKTFGLKPGTNRENSSLDMKSKSHKKMNTIHSEGLSGAKSQRAGRRRTMVQSQLSFVHKETNSATRLVKHSKTMQGRKSRGKTPRKGSAGARSTSLLAGQSKIPDTYEWLSLARSTAT